jgi:pyridoxal phosphate enzyme (YggS family)
VKASSAGRTFRPPALRRKHWAVVSNDQKLFEMNASLFDPAAAHADILARIAGAAKAAGRDPADVTLVAVSKQQAADAVAAVLEAGQTVFGENRVQEAMERWSPMRAGKTLHLIGPLQTNKAREAVAFFDVIETVDRERIAAALADEMARQARAPRLYVQVNTGEEPQKAGVAPKDADAFIAACRQTYGLEIEGLMCIPPADEPPGPHFALLAKIAARNGLAKLSMGMSDDFETAVRFGATSVRVGSALFGPRAS